MSTNLTPTYISNTFIQKSFSDGIDTISADTALTETAYQVLINGRQRFGYIDPIKKHKAYANAPVGKKQGCFGLGNILIIFVAGAAWYKIEGDETWYAVAGFQLDATVDKIYTEAVPASTMNFVRKLVSADDLSTIKLSADFKVSGTPACIVAQDGINQPNILELNSNSNTITGRKAKTFTQWNNTSANLNDREYVPIGKQMLYLGTGILLIVAKDGQSVYRSITGRPLDFMVNVDTDGHKAASEKVGGAETVSFALDYNEITCIAPVNIPDSFAYCTGRNVRIITADFTTTIFNEPLFRTSAIIESGVVNQYSFIEILGGYAFIDFEGVISFDAVTQLKMNGRNSIFSLEVSKVVKDIRQATCCAINFSNFSLFSIDTIWGNCIAVYDNLLQKWVSFDITEVTDIKQFTLTETTDKTRIYCVTADDHVYQLFESATLTYTATLFTKAFIALETKVEHKAQNLRLLFNSGQVAGTATITEYVDGQSVSSSISKDLVAAPLGAIVPPFLSDTALNTDNPSFVLKDGKLGKKLAYIISWNNDAKLLEFELTTSWKKSDSSNQESNKKLKNIYG